ncbi:MAG: phosphoribosyltransferase family protein, partial [Candidatus Aminicenantes bacterium]|nr:phosphoribosyltransferase family protein [Candidatus Aminicenantes bacterium]
LLAAKIRREVPDFDTVVSPAYGAIAIGFLAALKLGKRFAFTQRVDEKMSVRSGFSGLDGGRAVIVEDILTTGGSIQEVLACLKERRVEVAGVYVLVDRSGGSVPVEGQAVRSLLALKVEAFEPDACPLCRQGLPLTKPGASDKKT